MGTEAFRLRPNTRYATLCYVCLCDYATG